MGSPPERARCCAVCQFDFELFDQENNAKCTICPRCRILRTIFEDPPNDTPKVHFPRTTHHQAAGSTLHVGQHSASGWNMMRPEEHCPTLEKKRPRGRSRSSSRTFDANDRSNSSVAANVGSRRRLPQRDREFFNQTPGLSTLDQSDLSGTATVGRQPSPQCKRDSTSRIPGLLTIPKAPTALVNSPATVSETLAPGSDNEINSPNTKVDSGRRKRRRRNKHEVFTDVSWFALEKTGEWGFLAEPIPQGDHIGFKQLRTASVQAEVGETPAYGTHHTLGTSAQAKPSVPEVQSSKHRPRKVRKGLRQRFEEMGGTARIEYLESEVENLKEKLGNKQEND